MTEERTEEQDIPDVNVPPEYIELLRKAADDKVVPELSDPVVKESKPVKEVEQKPTTVTLSMEQFNLMMQSMTTLAQQVDALKNELEVQRSSVPPTLPNQPDAQSEEAVMLTMKKIGQAREMIKEQRLSQARESLDLATEAALIDYRKNPPKSRR